MDTVLLATKLFVPQPRQIQVTRPRLDGLIDQVITHALTLVSAPAGYGKTTLVSTWLAHVDFPVAWLSLEEEDNDPRRFLQYLLAAVKKIIPTVQVEALLTIPEQELSATNMVVGAIINQIAEKPGPFILVLDDIHTIQNQSVLDLLIFLIAHIPPQLHLVMLTRVDPLLPLARLRARDQLFEVRANQLRFTAGETGQYLNEVMRLGLSRDESHSLAQRTEGWIAGLQMAALSLQDCADPQQLITAFAGSHAYVMDYLTEEVLARQPESTRAFLLRTSILERMCGPLCDALIKDEGGRMKDEDGDSSFILPPSSFILQGLERQNLFLIPLDAERTWYRYHHLFADVLRRRLEFEDTHQITELHRCASEWFEQHGLITESINHALKAKDRDHAMRLFEENGCQYLIRGETATLLRWIEAIQPFPEDRPWLSIQKAWALILAGRWGEAEPLLAQAEHILAPLQHTSPVRTALGTLEAGRAQAAIMQGNASLISLHAQNALDLLPESDPFSCSMRSISMGILGDSFWITGDLDQAQQASRKAIEVGQAANDPNTVILAKSTLAEIQVEQGQYRDAEREWTAALQMATRADGQISPLAGEIYAGLGKIHYEWNQLEFARRHFDQSSQICHTWGNKTQSILNCIWQARLEHLLGNANAAEGAIQQAENGLQAYPIPRIRLIKAKSALACFHIWQGNLGKATHWLSTEDGISSQEISAEIQSLQEPFHFAFLRLFLAQGELEKARILVGRLWNHLRKTSRTSRMLEALILQALIEQKRGSLPEALSSLEKALVLAEAHGFVRIFLDEGEPMARLLYQVKKRSPGDSYSIFILKDLEGGSGQKSQASQPLVEPLSPREIEVLRLIARGCSNQEIAASLVISAGTVKRHISNIYAKLGVASRTQAVAFAGELKLIE